MKSINSFRLLIAFTICTFSVNAQNSLSHATQVEVGIGYVVPFFNKGNALLQAKALRSAQQSYYMDGAGNRKDVGKYSRSAGYHLLIGFYKPVSRVKGLMLGTLVSNTQTGSTPEKGGYDEAYFFNFITAGIAAKYYPFEKNNLFLKTDFGLAAVLTKNRYRNSNNEQNFFHQFGIGNALGFQLGYGFTPFRNKLQSIEVKTGYQLINTRVEVNGIGDDHWQFVALFTGVSFNF